MRSTSFGRKTLLVAHRINTHMNITEIEIKPKTPEQSRLDVLKGTKDRAAQALAAERERQQVANAQKTLAAAHQTKPTNLATNTPSSN
jgi:hypothetical protein